MRLCFVTGSRADYGLLRPLISLAKDDASFEASILATGSHLSPEFGHTYREIERDGFPISERLEILVSSDTRVGVVKSMGLAMTGLADALPRIAPNAVVILGDRYEAFCAAAAAHVLHIPIVHLHGGEVTEGAYDDAFRHSITKMASLHLAAAEEYANRIKTMGEEPDRVFTVGAIGLDNLRNLDPIPRETLERDLGCVLGGEVFLVTFHPTTLDSEDAVAQVNELFAALDTYPEAVIIITKANADDQGRAINMEIERHAASHPGRVLAFDSLGRHRYLSLMKLCRAVVGNSSSGIIEAPTAGVPTVNVGDRQKGRLRAASVIDCHCGCESIKAALQQACSTEYGALARMSVNPYENGHTAVRALEIIRNGSNLLARRKKFNDTW